MKESIFNRVGSTETVTSPPRGSRAARWQLKTCSTLVCTWMRFVAFRRSSAKMNMTTHSQAPLTIQSHAPLELLHQFFVKLGARYVVVTDADGNCNSIHSMQYNAI